jgi:glycosyltransferase 2 family protein
VGNALRIKKVLSSLLRVSVAVLLIGYALWKGMIDIKGLRAALGHWPLLAGTAASVFTVNLLLTYRFLVLLRAQDIRLSYWDALRLTYVGLLFNNCMPQSTGGDVVKGYYIATSQEKSAHGVAAVVMDRVMGLYAMFTIAATTLAAKALTSGLPGTLADIACVVAIIWLGISLGLGLFLLDMLKWIRVPGGLAGSRLARPVVSLYRACVSYRHKPGALARCIGLSIALQAISMLGMVLAGRALGDAKLSVLDYFILVPLGLVINATPGFPGGLGVGEVGFQKLFELEPFCSKIGGNVAAILHTLTISLSLLGIFFYLQGFRKHGHTEGHAR